MSTMEMAIDILKNMDEMQLEAFVTMFKRFISESVSNEDEEQAKRNAAFEELEQIRKMIKPVSADFDEKAEYMAYLDKRYGV